MVDSPEGLVKHEDAKVQRAKWDRFDAALDRRWQQEAYRPRAHLDHVTGLGDHEAFLAIHQAAHDAVHKLGPHAGFTDYMATTELHEIHQAIQRTRRAAEAQRTG